LQWPTGILNGNQKVKVLDLLDVAVDNSVISNYVAKNLRDANLMEDKKAFEKMIFWQNKESLNWEGLGQHSRSKI